MEAAGYQILIMRYLQSKQLLIQQIRNLIAKGVDGLIVSLVVADDEIKRIGIMSGSSSLLWSYGAGRYQ